MLVTNRDMTPAEVVRRQRRWLIPERYRVLKSEIDRPACSSTDCLSAPCPRQHLASWPWITADAPALSSPAAICRRSCIG
jgi:hypothetical protein